ncbi:MAG TPA: DUF305 domain-containing protein [Chloroflexota bacterium]|nr:DUF305 domain-containing protein [Chloroflexota bacterium]
MLLWFVHRAGAARAVGAVMLVLATLPRLAAAQAPPAGLEQPIPVIASGAAPAQVPFDQQFIDMMVPHHQGAVEMARIALQRASRPEIRQLADDIARSQSAEIDQLRAWRQAWFGSPDTPPLSQMPMLAGATGGAEMVHDMSAEVEQLRAAPEPFELAFIDLMIPHHQSAIEAARLALERAEHEELRALAQAIIAAQQREIDQLRAWRAAWFPAPAPPSPGHRGH